MMHYPPVYPTQKDTEFTRIISEYNVKEVVFGHIHGLNFGNNDFTDIFVNGIRYNLVSCDYLDFKFCLLYTSDVERDHFLSAEQALEYGIIDEIIYPKK